MASMITIKCLKTIIRNKNVLKHLYKYNFFIKYMLYKNAHNRTIWIFFSVIIFLKIGCANLDAAPISPILPYEEKFEVADYKYEVKFTKFIKFEMMGRVYGGLGNSNIGLNT